MGILSTLMLQILGWVAGGEPDPQPLLEVYVAAEGRKRQRAHLVDTANGRARRAEWDAHEHPNGYPLHHRWSSARTLLSDLRGVKA